MILGVFSMVAANAAIVLAARALTAHYTSQRRHLDLVLFAVFRLALISLTILIAGLTHLLFAWGLGLAGLLTLAVLLIPRENRRWPRWSRPDLGPIALILVGTIVARLILQVWFFAPYVGDAHFYRLPQLAEWIEAQQFTREIGNDVRAAFPAGFELIEAWWVVFLHHDVLIEIAGVEFLWLATAGSYAMAKQLGLSDRSSAIAALIYAMTPTLHLQATSCLNDGPCAAMVVATAVLIAARLPWSVILLAMGLGSGIKPTYTFAIPGLLVLAFLYHKDAPVKPDRLGWAAGLAGIGVCLGSFWYGRNWLMFGNPVYPFESMGAVVVQGGLHHQIGPDVKVLFQNLKALIDARIYDADGGTGPLAPLTSGWGAASFSLGLLGLVVTVRLDPLFRRWAVALGVSVISVFMLSAPDPWNCRFLLFFPALLAACAARMVDLCPGLRPLLWGALVVLWAGTMIPEELVGAPIRLLIAQDWRDRNIGFLRVPQEGSRPVALLGTVAPVYGWYRPDFSRRVIYLRTTSLEEVLRILKKEGADLVYAPGAPAMTDEAVRKRLLFPVRDGFYRTIPSGS
jgi:hypothetical protein